MKEKKALGWVRVDAETLKTRGGVPKRRLSGSLKDMRRMHPFARRKIQEKVAREKLERLLMPVERDITPLGKRQPQAFLDLGTGMAAVGVIFTGAALKYARDTYWLTKQLQAKTGCQKLVGATRCGKTIIKSDVLEDPSGRRFLRYWCEGGHEMTRFVK